MGAWVGASEVHLKQHAGRLISGFITGFKCMVSWVDVLDVVGPA